MGATQWGARFTPTSMADLASLRARANSLTRRRGQVIAGLTALAIGAGSLAFAASTMSGRSGSHTQGRTSSAQCPRARASRAGHGVDRAAGAVRAQLHAALPGTDVRGARIYGVLAHRTDEYIPGLTRRVYEQPPRKACGRAVADRSWAVLVALPRAKFADLYPAIFYVARTDAGW